MRNDVVIFVLHGYGMKAATFVEEFKCIANTGILVVAPEGLSRFYRKGFSGEVVASWMTSEDRLSEIEDYIEYLDKLYQSLVTDPGTRVLVIGYSQGASTASRWLMRGNSKVTKLVIWGGEFAADIKSFPTERPPIVHVMASADEFITKEQMDQQTIRLRSNGFDVSEYRFDGGHAIHQETLIQILDDFMT